MTSFVLPFLMFQGGVGSQALEFYLSVFPDSRVDEMQRYGPGEAGPEGTIHRARFTLGGQSVLCSDSFVKHAFAFTPSFSFWVECESADELRRLSGRLAEGGAELMPAGDYGFSSLFTWVNDRFGVSWQLNVS
ncbi:VOC family protein [Phenylobacterium sp. LjRoot219]|uniref:VOC family protein n=1 Tax=Phenylobacterium sp. LjRoot219 TaxID=3342283 RepID=UPI003ECF2F9E